MAWRPFIALRLVFFQGVYCAPNSFEDPSPSEGVEESIPNAIEGIGTKPPLSQRLEKVAAFENKMHELSASLDGRGIPSKIALDYEADAKGISEEANALIDKYGETLQYHKLQLSFRSGITGGKWTSLSLHAKNGDMCDDDKGRHLLPTRAWEEAPRIRKLLEPIKPALSRLRLSIMHPDTMIEWHCDDCPSYFRTADEDLPSMENLVAQWKGKYHGWVRLHLVLTDTRDFEFGIGGLKERGTEAGSFYLANVAMPHRVDNKGTSTRISLLIDVKVSRNRKLLKQSPIGRSILHAAQSLQKKHNAITYLKMGEALHDYMHGLSREDRFETEWYHHAWKSPLWRPLPPFQLHAFNSLNHCGVLGPLGNRVKMEALFENPKEGSGKYKRMMMRHEKQRMTEIRPEGLQLVK